MRVSRASGEVGFVMRIDRLHLHQFKQFEDAAFHFHPHFTVLIGNNATGKTSILDALSVAMGTYMLRSGIKFGRSGLAKDEVRLVTRTRGGEFFVEQQEDTFVEVWAQLHGHDFNWRRNIGDRGGAAKNLIQQGKLDRNRVSKDESVDLPVLLYYGSKRLWSTHRNVPAGKPESRLVGYRHCLEPKSDHHLFEKWFKRLEMAALQQRRTLEALETVRNAIIQCLQDVDAFYFDLASDRLMVGFDDGSQMPFDFLSDGYRNMIGMIADMAHRMFRLNPHLEREVTQLSRGVVLIDEIDLHLHPKWQRCVVDDLRNAFPQLQFIVTTHSPFILQSLEPGQVIDLNVGTIRLEELIAVDESAQPGPQGRFSHRSIEDIVEDVMGVPVPQRSKRYQEMYKTAQAYYKLLRKAESADVQEKEDLKRELDALAAPFSDNVAYHAFLEMERITAGLGKSEEGGV